VPQGFELHRLHGGEEQDIADAVGIGEQHYEAVEAEAQAARGRKAVFEGGDIVLIHLCGGIAGCALGSNLSFEALTLIDQGLTPLGNPRHPTFLFLTFFTSEELSKSLKLRGFSALRGAFWEQKWSTEIKRVPLLVKVGELLLLQILGCIRVDVQRC